MDLNRLQLTIDILEKVALAKKPFKMSAWCNYDKTEPCGTSACAFGYAALDPRFQEQGLSLVAVILTYDDNDDRELIRVEVRSIKDFNTIMKQYEEVDDISFTPIFQGYKHFEAANQFYDITLKAAKWLFDPALYNRRLKITPEDVIDRIKGVIANDGEEPQD